MSPGFGLPTEEDDETPYDVELLCSLLENLVAGRGVLQILEGEQPNPFTHIALTPDGSTIGSTVLVSVIGADAYIRAGVGAKISVGANWPDGEADLAIVVAGILDGGANECVMVEDDGQLRFDMMVKYQGGSRGFPVPPNSLLRKIPAWKSVDE